jgi:phenylpropionate dioxygenase-like ring-hydroxylating dioxygenase large terminal subunit
MTRRAGSKLLAIVERAAPTAPAGLERSLPSRWYRSPKIFRREKERILFREWFCGGREEQIPRPGDFLVLDVAGESVLVIRTAEGELAAHYNVCRHRGSRLCAEEKGRLPGVIRCPYHSWTYGLDGKLKGAPHLRDTLLRREEFSLYPIGVGTWGGFFFLNLTPLEAEAEGRTLEAQMGRAADRLSRYPLAELRSARRIVYEVGANWKVILENYNECYHCGPVHPELCEVVPAFKRRGGAGLDWEGGVPHREGAYTFTFDGTSRRATFPGLGERERTRHFGDLIYPNFMISLSPDHVAAFTLWPSGPRRTRVICDFLFHPEEMGKEGFDPSDAVDFWDLINRQDWTICEKVQEGLSSRVHLFGYYAPMEDLSVDIRRYVTDRIGRPKRG